MAASHFCADAIIHFGHACFSKVNNYPVFYVFMHLPIDVSIFGDRMYGTFSESSRKFLVFYSDEYYYELSTCLISFTLRRSRFRGQIINVHLFHLDKIREFAKSHVNIELAELAIDTPSDILCWKVPEPDLSDYVCIYLGIENQTFFNLTVSLKGRRFFCRHCENSIMIPPQNSTECDILFKLSIMINRA